jgi:hypothetical protein
MSIFATNSVAIEEGSIPSLFSDPDIGIFPFLLFWAYMLFAIKA